MWGFYQHVYTLWLSMHKGEGVYQQVHTVYEYKMLIKLMQILLFMFKYMNCLETGYNLSPHV